VENKRIENARVKEAESRAEEAKASAEEQKVRTERQKLDLERDRFRLDSEKAEQKQERQIKAERHEAEMKRMEPDEDFKQAQLQLLAGLSVLLPEFQKVLQVACQNYEFGTHTAIRASACAMLKKATEAKSVEDEEALKECAERLLQIAQDAKPAPRKMAVKKKKAPVRTGIMNSDGEEVTA